MKSDAKGEAKLRGFFGRYEVAVAQGGGWKKTVPVMLGRAQKGAVKVVLDKP